MSTHYSPRTTEFIKQMKKRKLIVQKSNKLLKISDLFDFVELEGLANSISRVVETR